MSSVFESVFDVVEDVADFIADDILEPVVDAVGDVVEGIADDPITFIAMAAATVIPGAQWAIPLISAASTAAKGGDIGDILVSAAASYVGGQVVGPAAGKYAATAVGGSAATKAAVSQIVGGATGAATSAVIRGEDPVDAFVSGGLQAGVSAGLGYIEATMLPKTTTVSGGTAGVPGPIGVPGAISEIPFFEEYPEIKNVIAASIGSALSGEKVTAGTIIGAVAKAQVTTELVREHINSAGFEFDPTVAEDASYLSFLTSTIQNVVDATFDPGKDVSDSLLASMNEYGTRQLNEILDEQIKSAINVISSGYGELDAVASELADGQSEFEDINARYEQEKADYNTAINDHNGVISAVNKEQNRVTELYDQITPAENAYNAGRAKSQGLVDKYNSTAEASHEAGKKYKRELEKLENEHRDEYGVVDYSPFAGTSYDEYGNEYNYTGYYDDIGVWQAAPVLPTNPKPEYDAELKKTKSELTAQQAENASLLDSLNGVITTYNSAATAFDNKYKTTYSPQLDTYKAAADKALVNVNTINTEAEKKVVHLEAVKEKHRATQENMSNAAGDLSDLEKKVKESAQKDIAHALTDGGFDEEWYSQEFSVSNAAEHWLQNKEGPVNPEQYKTELDYATTTLANKVAEAAGVPLTAMNAKERKELNAEAKLFIEEHDRFWEVTTPEALAAPETIPEFGNLVDTVSSKVASKVGKPETWEQQFDYLQGEDVTDLDIVAGRATLIADEDGELTWRSVYDTPSVKKWDKELNDFVVEKARFTPMNPTSHGYWMNESSGGTNVVNREGDGVGAFQIRPETAIQPGYNIPSLFPKLSAEIGAGKKYATAKEAYLANKEEVDAVLMDPLEAEAFVMDYHNIATEILGSPEAAILAYNQGIGSVQNAIAEGNFDPATTDYVSKHSAAAKTFDPNSEVGIATHTAEGEVVLTGYTEAEVLEMQGADDSTLLTAALDAGVISPAGGVPLETLQRINPRAWVAAQANADNSTSEDAKANMDPSIVSRMGAGRYIANVEKATENKGLAVFDDIFDHLYKIQTGERELAANRGKSNPLAGVLDATAQIIESWVGTFSFVAQQALPLIAAGNPLIFTDPKRMGEMVVAAQGDLKRVETVGAGLSAALLAKSVGLKTQAYIDAGNSVNEVLANINKDSKGNELTHEDGTPLSILEKMVNVGKAYKQVMTGPNWHAFWGENVGVELLEEAGSFLLGGAAGVGRKYVGKAVGEVKEIAAAQGKKWGITGVVLGDMAEVTGQTYMSTKNEVRNASLAAGMNSVQAEAYATDVATNSAATALLINGLTNQWLGGANLEKSLLKVMPGFKNKTKEVQAGIRSWASDIQESATKVLTAAGGEGFQEVAENLGSDLVKWFGLPYRKESLAAIGQAPSDITNEVLKGVTHSFIVGMGVGGGSVAATEVIDATESAAVHVFKSIVNTSTSKAISGSPGNLTYDPILDENIGFDASSIGANLELFNPSVREAVNTAPNTAEGAAQLKEQLNAAGITDKGIESNLLNKVYNEGYTSTVEAERAAAEATAEHDYVFSDEEVSSFVGNTPDTALSDIVNDHADAGYFSTEEIIAAAEAEGIVLSDDQVAQYVKQGDEQALTTTLREKLDSQATSPEEAKTIFEEDFADFKYTDEDIKKFIGPDITEAEAKLNIAELVEEETISPEEIKAIAAEQKITIDEQEAKDLAGQKNEQAESERLAELFGSRYTSPEEAEAMFKANFPDFVPTEEHIAAVTGEVSEDQAELDIGVLVDENTLSAEEVRALAEQQGLTLDDTEVEALVGQKNQVEEEAKLGPIFDERFVTPEEAEAYLADFEYAPTPEEISSFTGETSETEQQAAIETYTGDRKTTEKEATTYLEELGFDVSKLPEGFVDPYVKQGLQTETFKDIEEASDPFMVYEAEAVQALKDAGLADALPEDVAVLTGQYDQSLLAGKIKEATPGIRYGILQGKVTELADKLGMDTDALAQNIAGVETDIDAISNIIGKPATEVTDVDVDFVADIIAQQGALADPSLFTPTTAQLAYDVTGDGVIDINDQNLLSDRLQGQDQDTAFAPESKFQPATGIFAALDTQTQQQQQAQQQLQEQMQQQQQQQQQMQQQTQRQVQASNEREFQNMLIADANRMTKVDTPDPKPIKYLYDISGESIFATPEQEKFYRSPWEMTASAGGVVDSNAALLKLIGGR